MHVTKKSRFEHGWTVGVVAVMGVANLGLWFDAPVFEAILQGLQFDRAAIRNGEFWRLVTGNLVHWSVEHCLLDVAAFALLGWLYEPAFRRNNQKHSRRQRQLWSLPVMLLVTSCGVGLTVLVLQPEMMIYRGLSGVDSGLFAIALMFECSEAKNDGARWWYVVPAALVFVVKLGFEVTTGGMFFGTESLGDLGQPVPLAHLSGAVFASACFIARTITKPKCLTTMSPQYVTQSQSIVTS